MDERLPNPLVVRFGALGDLIQATSMFESLYRAWGQPCDLLAAHGCPVAVLPGMTDPRRCAPRGAPGSVQVVASIPESAWPDAPTLWQTVHRMEAIGVDAVLAGWQAAYASRPADPAA